MLIIRTVISYITLANFKPGTKITSIFLYILWIIKLKLQKTWHLRFASCFLRICLSSCSRINKKKKRKWTILSFQWFIFCSSKLETLEVFQFIRPFEHLQNKKGYVTLFFNVITVTTTKKAIFIFYRATLNSCII